MNVFGPLSMRCCIAIAGLLLLTGCRFESGNSSAVAESELAEMSLAAQIEAVKLGRSDKIQLTQSPIRDADIDSILAAENLAVLQMDHLENQITFVGIQKLAALPSLIHLRIRTGQIDDQAAESLAEIKSLVILNIPHTSITPAGLAKLATLPRLVQLRLGSRQLGDDSMELMATFPKLKRLHLIDVPIADRSLEVFAKLDQLESLYVDGASFTGDKLDWLVAEREDLHLHLNQQHHDHDPKKDDHGPHAPE